MKLEIAGKTIQRQCKKLYLTAFPKEERAPFWLIRSRAKSGRAEMLAAYDENEFVGFAYMVCHKDLTYLFYLAVMENMRGKGYGSKILEAIKSRYRGKRIFLAREQLDKTADNFAQRISRHQFYRRNGFEDLPCQIKEASVVYDVMGIGGNVSAEEYDALISSWAGKFLTKIVDMKIIENNRNIPYH